MECGGSYTPLLSQILNLYIVDRRKFVKYLGGSALATLVAPEMMGNAVNRPAESVRMAKGKSLIADFGSLRFRPDGTLKILQITDCHYKVDDQLNSKPSIDRMREVLDIEKPDFVMYTGDVVVSNESFTGLDTVLGMVIDRNIPFALVFGNHDDEYDHSRAELYDYIARKKGAIMPKRVTDDAPDYVIPVKSSGLEDKTSALLYCIDSHSYTQIPSVPGYDWIKFSQIEWYRQVSEEYTRQNDGTPLPALAFFHIPLPEYRDAVMDEKNRIFGVKAEGVCCPTANSGFFLSAKECGDVMATFCGHDHDNDYAVMYRDIMLAYGRYTGGNTVYNDIPNGARVIVLHEGKREFDTYVRLAGGEIENKISYPKSFK